MDAHKHLVVWQLAGELVEAVYEFTRALPADERYVTVPQLRRASWSVANNIAEGHAKLGKRERRRFFDIALGSLAEIHTMGTRLGRLYPVDQTVVDRMEKLRTKITAGLFKMLRNK